MAPEKVQILDFFLEMISEALTFKVPVFVSDLLNFEEVSEYY